MGASLMDPGLVPGFGATSVKGLSKRMRCELLRGQAEAERSTFIAHWKELNDYILPRRGRFYVTDRNKGDRRSRNIYDSTATFGARTLSAGMMSGVTSPSRPWFHLTTPDPELNQLDSVKEWLYEVNRRMEVAFVRSNLYDELAVLYGDLGVFGTSAMLMLDDDEQIFRFYTFPVGSYSLYNDAKNRVRTFIRVFELTVQQLVERWGNINPVTGKPDFVDNPKASAISPAVQNLWTRGTYGAWISVVHLVQANLAYDGNKIESKYKRFESIYYELGTPNGRADQDSLGLLAHEGFDEFPVFCPRWDVNAEDIYATNCPGMTALGDIKELQVRTKRTAQAEEKMLNPPMTGPSSLKVAKASLLPGDVTYLDVQQGQQGFRPVHEIDFGSAFGPMEEKSKAIRMRIQRAFYEDLFLMLEQLDRKDITATEVAERKEEKLLALGPMLGRLDQDLLNQLIDRGFAIMDRKGLIPPAPPEIQNMQLRVEYVSIMAQALKTVGVASLERAAGFVGQIAQTDPSILDLVDGDELVRDHFDAIGVPPKILRSKDEVAQIRATRAKQQQTQQAAENAPGLAGAAKDLSQASTDGNSMLAKIVGGANARRTLNATAMPAASPV